MPKGSFEPCSLAVPGGPALGLPQAKKHMLNLPSCELSLAPSSLRHMGAATLVPRRTLGARDWGHPQFRVGEESGGGGVWRRKEPRPRVCRSDPHLPRGPRNVRGNVPPSSLIPRQHGAAHSTCHTPFTPVSPPKHQVLRCAPGSSAHAAEASACWHPCVCCLYVCMLYLTLHLGGRARSGSRPVVLGGPCGARD